MNKENLKLIHNKITSIADDLKKRLPDHPAHPRGRIPVAHVYTVIQAVFGKRCKDIRDVRLEEVLKVVDFCHEHAEDMHISSQLYNDIEPEPFDLEPQTLDRFFDDDR
jgi:hypothetical protein